MSNFSMALHSLNHDTLADVIERLKQGLTPVPEKESHQLLFWLSPNDLVYVPTEEEIESKGLMDLNYLTKDQVSRIYKFTDGGGTTANFIQTNVASLIFNLVKSEQIKLKVNYPIQNEFGLGSPQSKNQKSIQEIMIKDHCWKIELDRLGNIKKLVK